jgi:hypothetical protein
MQRSTRRSSPAPIARWSGRRSFPTIAPVAQAPPLLPAHACTRMCARSPHRAGDFQQIRHAKNTHILSRPRLPVWLNPDEISHDEEELNKLRKQQVVRTHAHTQTRMGTYMYTLDSPKVCGCNLRRALLRFCGYPCAQKRCLCVRVLLELEAESSLRAQIMPLPQNRLSQLHVHVCVYGT